MDIGSSPLNVILTFPQVAELKLELKLRGLPVSGTKTDLIERLKPFQDTFCSAAASAPPTSTLSSIPMEVTTTTAPAIVFPAQPAALETVSSTPPVSPTDPSMQTVGVSEALPENKRGAQPLLPPAGHGEKDRRLHEKERQIEELMRKLEQEQRLVEELKMQLEVEKRGQGGSEPPTLVSASLNTVPAVLNSVKREGSLLANCSPNTAPIPSPVLSSQPLAAPLAAPLAPPLASVVKLEDVTVSSSKLQLPAQSQLAAMNTGVQRRSPSQTSPQPPPAIPNLQQFFISHHGGVSQVLGQPQTLLTATNQAGTQILLPVTLPNNAAAIQLPNASLQVPHMTRGWGGLPDGPINSSSALSARPAGRRLQPGSGPDSSAADHQGGDGLRPSVSAAGPSIRLRFLLRSGLCS